MSGAATARATRRVPADGAAPPDAWPSRDLPAIGTHARVVLTDAAALDAAEALVRGQLDELDAAASRFRDDSELSRLVAAAPVTTTVSQVLAAAVAVALRAARETDGLVDPGLGAALRAAGYDRTYADLPSVSPASPAVPSTGGWRDVRLTGRTVHLPAGVPLDLGATAKAWAADRAAGTVARRLGTGCLVELGGDVAVSGPAPVGGWPVAVGDHGAETVTVARGGLATSSTGRRTWRRGDSAYHHVLDPRTGRPAPVVWRTVTVAAASCADANTASTAAVVLGPAAPGWLERRGLPARLETPDGRVTRVAGWPEEDR